jgi:hypothetical protein
MCACSSGRSTRANSFGVPWSAPFMRSGRVPLVDGSAALTRDTTSSWSTLPATAITTFDGT